MAYWGIKEELRTQIKGIFLLAFAVFSFTGVVFTEQTGHIGIIINNILRFLAGDVAILTPFIFGFFSLQFFISHKLSNLSSRLVGIIILFCLIAVTAHLNQMAGQVTLVKKEGFYLSCYHIGIHQQGGGLLGSLLAIMLYFFFRDIGSYIIIVTLSIVAVLLITDTSLTQFFSYLHKCITPALSKLKNLLVSQTKNLIKTTPVHQDYVHYSSQEAHTEKDTIKEEAEEKDDYPEEPKIITNQLPEPKDNEQEQNTIELDNNEKIKKIEEINSFRKKLGTSTRNSQKDYRLPPLELLTKSTRAGEPIQKKNVKERIKILENTLKSFGVKAKIVQAQVGPTVTRFEIQPEVGTKVSKIISLSDDLALNLAASQLRIEAPIPGKTVIGVEVPNKIISVVYLREVLEEKSFQESLSPLTICLGKDIAGVPVIADLLKMPHLLIAGATGAGKSVCLNTIVASILYKATPHEVKFLMIDPKMVELSVFNGIPHLIAPVIYDPKTASVALRKMVSEMENRYDIFARNGARDIGTYHKLCMEKGEEQLPYIVVLIDELSDLMMVAPAEVEDSIARLSQMSRAAGIHLVIATQRPSVDVLTGIIKANITSRIAFAVSAQADSRTILDMGGAEKLLGRGDMLFHPVGASKPIRVQGAFISEQDIKKLVTFVSQQESPNYNESFTCQETEQSKHDTTDPLFADAVELVVNTGQASISLLQRRFRIGYARAARIIDELENRGVVGQYMGSKPREVLINPEQIPQVIKKIKQTN